MSSRCRFSRRRSAASWDQTVELSRWSPQFDASSARRLPPFYSMQTESFSHCCVERDDPRRIDSGSLQVIDKGVEDRSMNSTKCRSSPGDLQGRTQMPGSRTQARRKAQICRLDSSFLSSSSRTLGSRGCAEMLTFQAPQPSLKSAVPKQAIHKQPPAPPYRRPSIPQA